MENEIKNYEAAVRAFESYCEERKLGWNLDTRHYPISVTVYQSGEFGQMKGQLSMEQQNKQEKIPSCTWTFVDGGIVLLPKNNWVMEDKIMNRLKNLAKKIEHTFLKQFFARAYCEVVEE